MLFEKDGLRGHVTVKPVSRAAVSRGHSGNITTERCDEREGDASPLKDTVRVIYTHITTTPFTPIKINFG